MISIFKGKNLSGLSREIKEDLSKWWNIDFPGKDWQLMSRFKAGFFPPLNRGTGNWTQDLIHTKYMLYHRAIPLRLGQFMIKITIALELFHKRILVFIWKNKLGNILIKEIVERKNAESILALEILTHLTKVHSLNHFGTCHPVQQQCKKLILLSLRIQ